MAENRSDPDAARFLDGEALRVARMKQVEKAFGIALTADEAARCTSAEATTAVFAARLGAVPGVGNLREGALAAVREALRAAVGADREAIAETSPLVPHFRRWRRARRWHRLRQELNCKLPPVRGTWATVAIQAPIVAAQAAFISAYPSHHFVEPSTMAWLVALVLLGFVGGAAAGCSVELPERFTAVEKVVTFLVAQRPAAYRGGTDWTTGQVAEVVDAVHRLRFFRPGCRRALTGRTLAALLLLALLGTTFALCVLGLVSTVVVGPLPPGLR